MAHQIRLGFENIRTLPFGSIGASYTAIGTPLGNPARMIIINNGTDAALGFSDDGVNDKFVLFAGISMVLDISSNQNKDDGFFFGKGQSLFVKTIGIPTSGEVFFSVVYGQPA